MGPFTYLINIALFLGSFGFFVWIVYKRLHLVLGGAITDIRPTLMQRLRSLLLNVMFQEKLFKHPVRGTMHALFFYGFLLYIFHSTGQMIAANGFPLFENIRIDPYRFSLIPERGSLPHSFPSAIALLLLFGSTALTFFLYRKKHHGHLFELKEHARGQGLLIGALSLQGFMILSTMLLSGREFFGSILNLFSFLILCSVLFFAYMRWVRRLKGLDVPSTQSAIVLLLISTLMIATLCASGASYAAGYGESLFDPLTAELLALLGMRDAVAVWHFSWWAHLISVYGFLIYIPVSKHAHLIFAPINYVMIDAAPRGAMPLMDLESDSATFGASKLNELSRKALLDSLACIECGRCTIECPANLTGKPLDPKKIMVDIKHAIYEYQDGPLKGSGVPASVIGEPYISEEELWGCTACRACVEACPVGNNQLGAIFEMRRNLVLDKSLFPAQLQSAFVNMEKNSNPWGIGAGTRADWCRDLGVKSLAEDRNVDLLYWVGCAGSFDEKNKRVSRSLVKIMQAAGIKFGILGNEESCTGDSARRAGNEYLFQTLAATNIETLNRYGVKRIITACPHCFNTLKNEYPQIGGNYEVMHHSEFVGGLVRDGRLTLKSKSPEVASYHDSCYLGRFNDLFDDQRNLIRDAGFTLREPEKFAAEGMCCGAGGAQMWMEEKYDRVNLKRTDQLLATDPSVIATACPFCNIMMSDGVKSKQRSETVRVLDIAEIVANAIE